MTTTTTITLFTKRFVIKHKGFSHILWTKKHWHDSYIICLKNVLRQTHTSHFIGDCSLYIHTRCGLDSHWNFIRVKNIKKQCLLSAYDCVRLLCIYVHPFHSYTCTHFGTIFYWGKHIHSYYISKIYCFNGALLNILIILTLVNRKKGPIYIYIVIYVINIKVRQKRRRRHPLQ